MIDEWKDWIKYHGRLFGLASAPGADDTLMEWADLFARLGYTPAEMREASEFAALDPPRFYSEHLGALQDRVKDRRLRDADRRQPEDDPRGVCDACKNTGWVVVPFEGLRTKMGGAFPPGSAGAVLCGCENTGWLWRTRNEERPPLMFDQYRRSHPDWRAKLLEIEGLIRQRAAAREAAARLDGRKPDNAFDAVIARLRRRMKETQQVSQKE